LRGYSSPAIRRVEGVEGVTRTGFDEKECELVLFCWAVAAHVMVWQRFYVLCSPYFAIGARAKIHRSRGFARCDSSLQPVRSTAMRMALAAPQ
jgi:hypothetical protein